MSSYVELTKTILTTPGKIKTTCFKFSQGLSIVLIPDQAKQDFKRSFVNLGLLLKKVKFVSFQNDLKYFVFVFSDFSGMYWTLEVLSRAIFHYMLWGKLILIGKTEVKVQLCPSLT